MREREREREREDQERPEPVFPEFPGKRQRGKRKLYCSQKSKPNFGRRRHFELKPPSNSLQGRINRSSWRWGTSKEFQSILFFFYPRPKKTKFFVSHSSGRLRNFLMAPSPFSLSVALMYPTENPVQPKGGRRRRYKEEGEGGKI